MRIHADLLTPDAIYAALGRLRDSGRVGGIFLMRNEEAGSRSRRRSIDVKLSSYASQLPDGKTCRRWANSGRHGASEWRAATYDEWGLFIAELFRLDPTARIGQYEGASDFQRQTRGAYQQPFIIVENP